MSNDAPGVVMAGMELIPSQVTDELGRKGIKIELRTAGQTFALISWISKRDALGALSELKEQIRDIYAK